MKKIYLLILLTVSSSVIGATAQAPMPTTHINVSNVPNLNLVNAPTMAAPKNEPITAPQKLPEQPESDINTPAKLAVQQSKEWAENETATPIRGKNGKVIFTYGEAVPTITCAPLRVCDLELEAGEYTVDLDVGDSVRWILKPSISGSGNKKTVHIIIKPKADNLDTNAVITTNRRTYHIRLISRSTAYVVRAAFYYPDSVKKAWEAQKAEMEKEETTVIGNLPPLSADNLVFYDIEVVNGSKRLKPETAFSDGKNKTYIKMPPAMGATEAPILLTISRTGKEELVNYRLKNGYYIIDKIFEKAVLISGIGSDQDRYLIKRRCKNPGIFGGCED
jgi:P-type conjugative transfer protein TrbG